MGREIRGTPSTYLNLLDTLQPGDILRLDAGDYLQATPGLPVFGIRGTAAAPIVITGPETGPKPRFLGTSTHNTIRFSDSSYVIVRNIEVDGRNLGGDGVNAQGHSHHITLENLYIHNVAENQQVVGISTNGATTWNWTIRRCIIENAGTGMYLGSSTGGNPFIAGVIENNLIRNTIGYNIEIKHQNPRPTNIAGIPTTRNSTVIRNNVFHKTSNSSTGDLARPNLLVGHWPLSGVGVDDTYEIYGNFFYQNPSEALFQGEGNIAFHDNLMIASGDALNIQAHNNQPRNVRIFNNTIIAPGRGIAVSGGAAGFTQTVVGNAVFAGTPVSLSGSGASQANNITGTQAQAPNFLNNPSGALGQLDLFPKAGLLSGAALDPAPWLGFVAADRDFNGTVKTWTMRGAYAGSGTNPGWLPKLEIKP